MKRRKTSKPDTFGPRIRFNWGYHDAHAEHERGTPRILVETGAQDIRHVSKTYDPTYHAGYRYGLRDTALGTYRNNSEPAWQESGLTDG